MRVVLASLIPYSRLGVFPSPSMRANIEWKRNPASLQNVFLNFAVSKGELFSWNITKDHSWAVRYLLLCFFCC